MKVFFGVVGASLFVAVVLRPALFIDRTLIKIPGLDELGFSPGPLIAVFACQAILAYAAGLFTIGFCQVVGTAGWVASACSFLTFLPYRLVSADAGRTPRPTRLVAGLD